MNAEEMIRINETAVLASAARTGSSGDSIERNWRRYIASWPYMKRMVEPVSSPEVKTTENMGRALMEKYIKYREKRKAEQLGK